MTHTFFLLVHFTDVCSLYLETNTKDCLSSLDGSQPSVHLRRDEVQAAILASRDSVCLSSIMLDTYF